MSTTIKITIAVISFLFSFFAIGIGGTFLYKYLTKKTVNEKQELGQPSENQSLKEKSNENSINEDHNLKNNSPNKVKKPRKISTRIKHKRNHLSHLT